jgi:hypothetical protein
LNGSLVVTAENDDVPGLNPTDCAARNAGVLRLA